MIVRRVISVLPRRLEPGVTILIPYYRTPDLIETCLENVRRHSSSFLKRVIVLDNGSGDGVGARLPGGIVEWVELPANCGHGWALDYGTWHVRTEFLVSLDSDAWPVSPCWLATLVSALQQGAAVAGIYAYRDFVHPSCLAIRTETVLRNRLSFMSNLPHRQEYEGFGREWWDVGENLSMVLRARGERIHKLMRDAPSSADKEIGLTYGGIVFHLWYGTRVVVDPARPEFYGLSREAILAERAKATGPPDSG